MLLHVGQGARRRRPDVGARRAARRRTRARPRSTTRPTNTWTPAGDHEHRPLPADDDRARGRTRPRRGRHRRRRHGGANAAVSLESAEIYDPATGTLERRGPDVRPRAMHTATLLPSGKVLVAGGYDGKNELASAELYDPEANNWSATGSLAAGPRLRHRHELPPSTSCRTTTSSSPAATAASARALASAEIYDPGDRHVARRREHGRRPPDGRGRAAEGRHGARHRRQGRPPGQRARHRRALRPRRRHVVRRGRDDGRPARATRSRRWTTAARSSSAATPAASTPGLAAVERYSPVTHDGHRRRVRQPRRRDAERRRARRRQEHGHRPARRRRGHARGPGRLRDRLGHVLERLGRHRRLLRRRPGVHAEGGRGAQRHADGGRQHRGRHDHRRAQRDGHRPGDRRRPEPPRRAPASGSAGRLRPDRLREPDAAPGDQGREGRLRRPRDVHGARTPAATAARARR